MPLLTPPEMKKIAKSEKRTIGINFATVAVSVNIFDVFKPAMFMILNRISKAILIGKLLPSKAGKVMMKILAKPASIAAQAITVTAQPRIPTLKPTKSPKAAFEYCMAPPFLSK